MIVFSNGAVSIITFILSGVALGVSMKSCSNSSNSIRISEEANAISKEALEYTKHSFEETQKPELVLEPVAGENGPYIQYQKQNGKFNAIAEIKITNIGKRPATNITYPKASMTIKAFGKEVVTRMSPPPGTPLSLSSNKSYHFVFHITSNFASTLTSITPFKVSVEEAVDKLKKEDTPAIIDIAVNYIDPYTAKAYTVSALFRVKRWETDILSYDNY